MVYYARSENNKGEKETVSHHLQLTAELAGEYADIFDEKQNAQCVALLHDLGKYTVMFKEVLQHTRTGVNHAAVGAALLKDCVILATIVYAHHSELDWDINTILEDIWNGNRERDDIGKRISAVGKNEILKCLEIFRKENEFITPKKISWVNDISNKFLYCIEIMLYTRMLYSCLVDADYTASASHFDEKYLMLCKEKNMDADRQFNILTEYKERISKNSKANSDVNKLRNKIYDDCVEAADRKSGMFTLTAPTGSGKTLALLAFALRHAVKRKKRRIIIVLPFLSIIEQNAQIYNDICENVFEQHSATDYHKTEDNEMLRIYADRWSADVIITTSVNFFEGLFKHRASDCRRLHNIANSIIVFDEAQSLPIGLIDSSISVLNCLCDKYRCSVVLSTATQPSFGYRKNIKWNSYEIIQNQKEIFRKLKRNEVIWDIEKRTDLYDIAKKISNSKSCCAIVNLKAHCEKLYNYVKEMCRDDSVYVISTNMCTEHRRDVIDKIKERLKEGQECRIISTQCIEAGVDIDVDEIYRSLAPLEAIIQSAGRCNRNGRLDRGKVTIFVPNEEKLYPDKNYEIAAMKVKILLSMYHDIDINDPEIIDEYYKMLFSDNENDDKKLREAIENIQFDEVERNYKFIKNGGVNIIVPYHPKQSLYDEVVEKIRENGISPSVIKMARGITVTSYDLDKVKNLCERTFQKAYFDGKEKQIETNWYILSEPNMYKDSGIQLDENEIDFIG